MDTLLEGYYSPMNHWQFDHGLVDESKLNHGLKDPVDPWFLPTNTNPLSDFSPSSSMNKHGDPADIGEPFLATLRYINYILMEEDLGDKTCMLQDSLALQAAEKSLYDALGQKYPPSSNHYPSCFNSETPDNYCNSSSSADSSNSSTTANNLVHPNCISNQSSFIDSPENTFLVPDLYSELQHFGLSSGGKVSNSRPNDDTVFSNTGLLYSREELEDSNYFVEERRNKHFAYSLSEHEPLEVFDEVLICKCENKSEPCLIHGLLKDGSSEKVQQIGQAKGSNSGTTGKKKKGKKREVVDLSTLLTTCAQAVASYDQRTATELLKQIRQNSSPFGDATQRLAYYFANGLEARLAGTQTPISIHLNSRASAADIIQAYKVYVTACPFNTISFSVANRTICKLAEKAPRLHIIDFGIGYGFQWPCLIQRSSKRPGGPPKIRITGIDFPQPGFRPAERVEETGRRLEAYCKRFNVPFEYNAIAEKWQNIQLEDLKIDREEITVVNSLFRMKHLPDDTVVIDSPRDAVLELIKKINPEIFIHGVVNGTHNAPFFLARFREALFHFSTFFDMFEANVPREDQGRLLFEREIFGKDSMNVIACEDIERVERPETYKHWQSRNLRIGFEQLPLDKDILKRVKSLLKLNYHKDFVIDEDGQWMLQGWKGRVTHALSVWKSVQD
ncbi:scarecrow-like protein 30 [Mangifera indica]|uniref:scarecrow-like protein 30 n=1 Tax=Mangifera indica TaxID=29780 RepID=UPI001CFA1EDE|nr:scarecrow-like protein 30 [Mangifera indica]